MFVAHLAGGFLATRFYLANKATSEADGKLQSFLLFGLVCSVLPDFDLFYFYLIDNRQHPHHSYWTHMPVFWLLVPGLLYSVANALLRKNIGLWCVLLFINTQLHMVLDSVAGGIYWLYPFGAEKYRIFEVTARFDWWVFNYIFHWTFLLELLIIVAAGYVYWSDRKLLPATAKQFE